MTWTTVLLVDAAGEQRRQQLVLLDPVVERVDHPVERLSPACPLVERRMVSHAGHGIECGPGIRCDADDGGGSLTNGLNPGTDEWRALVDEPIVDPEQRIIDTHHHLWPSDGLLPYGVDELQADTGRRPPRRAHGVRRVPRGLPDRWFGRVRAGRRDRVRCGRSAGQRRTHRWDRRSRRPAVAEPRRRSRCARRGGPGLVPWYPPSARLAPIRRPPSASRDAHRPGSQPIRRSAPVWAVSALVA